MGPASDDFDLGGESGIGRSLFLSRNQNQGFNKGKGKKGERGEEGEKARPTNPQTFMRQNFVPLPLVFSPLLHRVFAGRATEEEEEAQLSHSPSSPFPIKIPP